jgi:multimeric flavodoxin WrbA
MKDDATVLTQCLAQSDLFVVLTPVTFGGCSSLVKQALERVVLPILLPYFDCVGGEIHHPLRYGTPIRLLAVGALPDKDPKSEEIFRAVFSRNAKNLHSPALGTTFVYDGMSAQEIEEDMKRLVLETGVGS